MKNIQVGEIVELTKKWQSPNAFVRKGSRGIVTAIDEYVTVSIFDCFVTSNDHKRNKFPIRVHPSNLTKGDY